LPPSKELLMYKEAGFDFGAAYVGGGTPALVHEELAEFLEFVQQHFTLSELSVEANPRVSDAAVESFLAVGVDRFSVGVQSFDDGMLKKLGRESYGSGEEIRERINQLLGKFRILNVDFIFNVPGHDPEILARDLEIVVEDKIDQLTTYPLMEAQQNRSYVSRQGKIDYDLEAKLYKQVILPTLREEYTPVSSWCFSRKDKPDIDMLDEYVVDYFDYVGIGTGSMSLHDSRVRVNAYTLPLYQRMVNSGKLPLVLQTHKLPRRDYMQYYLMMALFGRRLSFKQFEQIFGVPFKRAMWLVARVVGAEGAQPGRGKGRLRLHQRAGDVRLLDDPARVLHPRQPLPQPQDRLAQTGGQAGRGNADFRAGSRRRLESSQVFE